MSKCMRFPCKYECYVTECKNENDDEIDCNCFITHSIDVVLCNRGDKCVICDLLQTPNGFHLRAQQLLHSIFQNVDFGNYLCTCDIPFNPKNNCTQKNNQIEKLT